jgi:hypothetical protein
MHGQSWRTALGEALNGLALSADGQIRRSGLDCAACELLYDFDLARAVAADDPRLTGEERACLGAIERAVQSMTESDRECFNDEVLGRPAWQELRRLAAEGLRTFGWENSARRLANDALVGRR